MQAMGGIALFLNTPLTDLLNFGSGLVMDANAEEIAKLWPGEDPAKRMLIYGMPGIVDLDVSDYMGVGSISDFTRGPLGPAVSDVNWIRKFFGQMAADYHTTGRVSNETANMLVQRVAPSQIRRLIRAADILGTGEVRNPYTAKLIYRADERLGGLLYETTRESAGFPRIGMQQERLADAIASRVTEHHNRVRSSYSKDIAFAIRSGDRAKALKLQADARESGINIDQRSIDYQLKELARPGEERRRRRLPKDLREQFEITGLLNP
jgi:hypothetical protein